MKKIFENKRNMVIILISLIIVVLGIWTYKCIANSHKEKADPYKELIQKVDSLNAKIETLELQRDTINN